ncbi:MAG: prepilin-type N-terminal cleavage/methylation domain-containing protein [Synechococcaceae cyanobacterium SM2_3_60]|nr:prepilin-type N-terminal cleavage/methylation domain-containing protein [Synechococcaceae cyanobacterium SM2_3_60]
MYAHRLRSNSGFTLIELLVVVVIVGVLSAVAVPTMVNQTRRSRLAEAQAGLDGLRTVSEVYRFDMGTYPSDYDDIAATGPNAGRYMDADWVDTAPNYQDPTCVGCNVNGALWSTESIGDAYVSVSGNNLICEMGLGAAAGTETNPARGNCNLFQ